ncbi:MAG: hypothetical protein JNL72_00245 [Flavipsychrobacter sp.]|nr:hypothetical protein [Flavipsychrobacter sp.]
MKRTTSLLFCLLITAAAGASPMLHFKISRVVCLLTFLETAAGDPHTSSTLRTYITSHLPAEDSSDFYLLVGRFRSLNIDHSYVLPEYPQQRQKPRSSMGLVNIAAVQSESLPEFFSRIAGVLPNEQLLLLKDVLAKAEYYYDEIVMKNSKFLIEKQLNEIKLYNYKTRTAFQRLKTFYGSTWADNWPFTVAIYPVPGKSGHTTATPHNNSLIMGMFTEEKDYPGRIGVALHEICHVLYEEQPLSLQWKLDSAFSSSTSLSATFAYTYLDEALATACGNGWMYEFLTGGTDKTAWYNDEYIDKYAHALYPMVKDYVENLRTIDRRFITSAIRIFDEQFPEAAYEYQNLFNKMYFYTDAGSSDEYQGIMNTLGRYYRITSCYSSYPITDPQSLAMAGSNQGTQLFIVHTNQAQNFSALRKLFPELMAVNEHEEGIISFFDKEKRPVIIMNVKDASRIEYALKKMTETKKISAGLSSVSLN